MLRTMASSSNDYLLKGLTTTNDDTRRDHYAILAYLHHAVEYRRKKEYRAEHISCKPTCNQRGRRDYVESGVYCP